MIAKEDALSRSWVGHGIQDDESVSVDNFPRLVFSTSLHGRMRAHQERDSDWSRERGSLGDGVRSYLVRRLRLLFAGLFGF